MTRFKNTLMPILVIFLIAGFVMGCAQTPDGPSAGAYARAEKEGEIKDNNGDDPFDPRIPVGEQIKLTELPGVPAGICDMIHFDYDKSEIKQEWVECLTLIAQYMTERPEYDLIIEGHCDERGTNEYNMALGERRSKSAADFLIQKGMDAGRITTNSFGEEQPLKTCSDESCWKVNRRAEFYAVKQAR